MCEKTIRITEFVYTTYFTVSGVRKHFVPVYQFKKLCKFQGNGSTNFGGWADDFCLCYVTKNPDEIHY